MTKDIMYMTFFTSSNLYTLCTLIVILLSKRCSGAYYQYDACVPKNCDRGPKISFPFYISGLQESYCGYPGFNLSCNDDGFPILKLPKNDYVVQDIFYWNQSVRVFDAVALRPDSSGCLLRIRNTTLPAYSFNYSNNLRALYLFSSCRKPLPQALLRYNLSCESSGDGNNWDLALYGEDENLRKVMETCDRNVIAPVEDYGGDKGNIGIESVAEVVLRGFVLNWTASSCSVCENSGGRCGFDGESYHFRCFCTDRPHSVSCPDRHGKLFLLFQMLFTSF